MKYEKKDEETSVFLMDKEPIPGWTIDDLQEWYRCHPGESGLAEAFAAASNKFFWVADTEYDFEEGTPEQKEASERIALWGKTMDRLKEEIFEILKREGVEIPETGQITVLSPFMERNGFYDGDGWWIRKP